METPSTQNPVTELSNESVQLTQCCPSTAHGVVVVIAVVGATVAHGAGESTDLRK
jgi:hypothetical protein